MLQFKCPHCRKRIRTADDAIGTAGKCPSCRKVVKIPASFPQASKTPKPISPIPIVVASPPTLATPIDDTPIVCGLDHRQGVLSPSRDRGTQQKPSNAEGSLWEEAFSAKHLKAFGLGMLTFGLLGPVASHEIYEAALGEAPAAQPSSQPQPQTPAQVTCEGCGKLINASDSTCPHCGNTQWGGTIAMGFISVVLFVLAIWAFLSIDNSALRYLLGLGAGACGLFFLIHTVIEIINSKRSDDVRVAYRNALALADAQSQRDRKRKTKHPSDGQSAN